MLKKLFDFTVRCLKCGAEHLDMPGDDKTWRCRKCDAPLRR